MAQDFLREYTMVWLIWRQHRVQALVTAALLAALGVFAAMSGKAAATVLDWLPAAPVLVGMFWGAPLLAKELERGTQRLAFTQSVTRRRWLLTKVGGLGLVVMVAGLALGLIVSTWTSTFGGNRFGNPALFTGTGVVAGAWWLFAFLLGTATGSVVRRVLPALAVTVALFLVMLFAVFQARDAYADPIRQPYTQTAAGSYISGGTWVSRAGAEVASPLECANATQDKYMDCVENAGYSYMLFVQPPDRYWRFQWTETAILLLGAVILAAPVAYRVLRRPV
jgi:hypothetical protein